MSIVESLTKVVDPVIAQQREEERRKAREQGQRDDAGAPPHQFRCRVCDLEDGQGAYCPTCLADTMEPIAPPPRAPK